MTIQLGAWYTAAEVCEIFKISAVTLWRWKRAGIVVPYIIGRTARYRGVDLLNAAKKQSFTHDNAA
jgi:predicted site-specific integrase-resolvase